MFLTVIIFILTLLILVVTHEFGHFIAARKFGVKVLEFGFGLPPRLLGKKIGDTLVSLNLLPIGGFVRLLGEDEVDEKVLKEKDSFAFQPVWQRIGIVVFGVVMNFLLAIVLFSVVLGAQNFKEKVPLFFPFEFIGVSQSDETVVIIGGVTSGSPAEEAGIKQGDQVVKINGVEINNDEQLVNLTREEAGKEIVLTLSDSADNQREVMVTPRVNPPEGEGPLGIALGTIKIANLHYETFGQKAVSGITHSYNLASYSMAVLGQVISQSWQKQDLQPVSQSLSGPVGITQIAGAIVHTESPFIPYLNFMALLSLNLAIVNILPFPALDGGRLVFLLFEAVFRRKVKPEIEKFIHLAGMFLLIVLIVLITFSDIRKVFP